MDPKLVDILACPKCGAQLDLFIEVQQGDDVSTGTLRCTRCQTEYSISDGIPDLLLKNAVPGSTEDSPPPA